MIAAETESESASLKLLSLIENFTQSQKIAILKQQQSYGLNALMSYFWRFSNTMKSQGRFEIV